MSRPDDSSWRPPNYGFQQAGAGLPITKMCDSCHTPKGNAGGKFRRRGTLRLWDCAGCVKRKEAA